MPQEIDLSDDDLAQATPVGAEVDLSDEDIAGSRAGYAVPEYDESGGKLIDDAWWLTKGAKPRYAPPVKEWETGPMPTGMKVGPSGLRALGAHLKTAVKEAPKAILQHPGGFLAGVEEATLAGKAALADAVTFGGFGKMAQARGLPVQELADRQKLANVGGTIVGSTVGPGAAVSRGLSRVLPQVASPSLLAAAGVRTPGLTNVLARTGRGAALGAAGGAVEGGGRALVEGQGLGGAARAAGEGAVFGAGFGAVSEGGLASAARLFRNMPGRATTQRMQQLTAGAKPSVGTRLIGHGRKNVESVDDFVERNPAIRSAVGDPVQMEEAVEAVLQPKLARTTPIYNKLDQVAGPVPVADVLNDFDDAIRAELRPGGDQRVRGALQDTRDEIIEIAAQQGAQNPLQATWTHRELRDFVSRRLKAQYKSLGSFDATEAYEVKAAVHDIANKALNKQIDLAARFAEATPLRRGWEGGTASQRLAQNSLVNDIKELRSINQEIAIGLNIQGAASSAIERSMRVTKSGLSNVAAAAVGSSIAGGGGTIPQAIGGVIGTKVIPRLFEGGKRAVTRKAARFSQRQRSIKPSTVPSIFQLKTRAEEEK